MRPHFPHVSAGGKEAMTSGVGAFNKAASWAYEQLSVQEKERGQKLRVVGVLKLPQLMCSIERLQYLCEENS